MTARPRLVAALLSVAAAGALVLLTGASASAHASLLSTSPDQGAVVATTPGQVVLTFNEPIRTEAGSVHGFKPDGSDWALDFQGEDNRLVVTPDEDPGNGTVVVAWKVISADGHEVGGALTFSIGAASAGTSAPGAAPPARDSVVLVRWIATAACIVGLVTMLVVLLVSPWSLPTRRRRLGLLWSTAFAAALLVVPLDQLVVDGRGLRGLGDWLAWTDGLTRGRSLILLAGVLVAAVPVHLEWRRTSAPTVLRAGLVTLAALSSAVGLTAVVTWPSGTAEVATATPDERRGPTTQQADLGAEGTVTLTVHQAPGEAVRLTVELTGADGGTLVPYATPTLRVSGADVGLGEADLHRAGPGRYRATVTIPRAGEWTAEVSVRTSRFDNPVATVPFTIG